MCVNIVIFYPIRTCESYCCLKQLCTNLSCLERATLSALFCTKSALIICHFNRVMNKEGPLSHNLQLKNSSLHPQLSSSRYGTMSSIGRFWLVSQTPCSSHQTCAFVFCDVLYKEQLLTLVFRALQLSCPMIKPPH